VSIRMDHRTDGQRRDDGTDGWKGQPPKDIIEVDSNLRDLKVLTLKVILFPQSNPISQKD